MPKSREQQLPEPAGLCELSDRSSAPRGHPAGAGRAARAAHGGGAALRGAGRAGRSPRARRACGSAARHGSDGAHGDGRDLSPAGSPERELAARGTTQLSSPEGQQPQIPPGPRSRACPAGTARLGTEGGRQGKGDSHATPARRRTDLPELQGGDDHEDEAAEAEAGPIPVRQAGIGLALQEL